MVRTALPLGHHSVKDDDVSNEVSDAKVSIMMGRSPIPTAVKSHALF